MKGSEIRSHFLNFFKERGHTVVPSSPLVPNNDPTLLFVNSGMVPFKDCFLGADKRPYVRATSCQKSIRISGKHNDFENVGVTPRHHTFFEMLGNFSFGDYFKEDAIKYAWEFISTVLKLPEERLWITIFKDDPESGELWQKLAGVKPERIIKLGEEDNFWQMGDTGPCGPCTEIHYYLGADLTKQSTELFHKDDGSFVEIWNLVFMQFNRSADGKLSPLPKPSVDTGLGFERVAAIMQGGRSNYDTDLLRPIVTKIEELSGFRYEGSRFTTVGSGSDADYVRDVAMRVMADHLRAMTFLIADGVLPASDGRGYILRRIIRRAIRHGRVLQFKAPVLKILCNEVISLFSPVYPELEENRATILKVADGEERKFHETLDSGLTILEREIAKLPAGSLFPGEVAFQLHDTYGFPLDLTQDALKRYNLAVDINKFESAMAAQKERSREDRRSHGISFKSQVVNGNPTRFLGYQVTESEAKIQNILKDETRADLVTLCTDQTPFYAESGGQVGDTGTISFDGVTLEVIDTQKSPNGVFLHHAITKSGEVSDKLIGAPANLIVDASRRSLIRANHSATHLVHWALRKVLGEHVKQAGSLVDERRLRFDYSHFEKVTQSQLDEIQELVNSQIRENAPVDIREMKLDAAKKLGAMALFGEKYGEQVRVVQIGEHSIELCGGTHVTRAGDIGLCLVASEDGVAAGVRRIECYSGSGALAETLNTKRDLLAIAERLRTSPSSILERLERLDERERALERELEALKDKLCSTQASDLAGQARDSGLGFKIIAECIDGADTDQLRTMVDRLRLQLGSSVVALAGRRPEGASLVVGVSSDLTSKINAGSIVKDAAKIAGGKGGGRADFAQAGGLQVARIEDALKKVCEIVTH